MVILIGVYVAVRCGLVLVWTLVLLIVFLKIMKLLNQIGMMGYTEAHSQLASSGHMRLIQW